MRVESATLLSLNVRAAYPGFELRVNQKLSLHGVTGVLGPSGSGKSTLLRIIAGLEESATGSVSFAGETWLDSEKRQFVPTHRRPVGYVFQNSRLFRHLDVEGNLRYAANRAINSSLEFDEIATNFELEGLMQRRTDTLSGGEQQRVAIARSLLAHPRLLLLDEPLASLDVGRKGEILPFLEALPGRFDIPIVYVSHAIEEVARLADQVLVLDEGRVSGFGAVTDVLNQIDVHASTSGFEAATVLETQVVEQVRDLHLTRLEYEGQTLVVPELSDRNTGDTVRVYVRAGDVALATHRPDGISFRNILSGVITAIDADAAGAFATVSIDIRKASLRANLTRHAIEELGLKVGLPVYALLKTASFARHH